MKATMTEVRCRYLGDGAYVSFDGEDVRIYTDNGISQDNEVFLEKEGVAAFLDFIRELTVAAENTRSWSR